MTVDEKLKEELLGAKDALFSGEENAVLLEVLRSCFPAINLAFVLDWVPEQGEDIYWVLVDNSRVAMIEIPRSTNKTPEYPLIEVQSIDDYKTRLSKTARRKLIAALELIRTHS